MRNREQEEIALIGRKQERKRWRLVSTVYLVYVEESLGTDCLVVLEVDWKSSLPGSWLMENRVRWLLVQPTEDLIIEACFRLSYHWIEVVSIELFLGEVGSWPLVPFVVADYHPDTSPGREGIACSPTGCGCDWIWL